MFSVFSSTLLYMSRRRCRAGRAQLWASTNEIMFLYCLSLGAILLILSAGSQIAKAGSAERSTVGVGTYLHAEEDSNSVVLVSPNTMFNLVVKAWADPPATHCMAAVTDTKVNPNTMVWAANNDLPLSVASSCRLFLSPDGDLLLQPDHDNKTAWHTHTSHLGVSNLTLLDSGNLILSTSQASIVWQSFSQSPSFLFYPGMNLTTNSTLYSYKPVPNGVNDFSIPGDFALQLHNNNLVLFTNGNDSTSQFVYWSSYYTNANPGAAEVAYVTIDLHAGFTFHDRSSAILGSIAPATTPLPSNESSPLQVVALVDWEFGDLQAFYLQTTSSGLHEWKLLYNSSIDTCQSPTRCGKLNLCSMRTGNCSCPPGFLQKIVSPTKSDCEPKTALPFPTTSPCSATKYTFVSVNVSFPPQLYPLTSHSVENCTAFCLRNCTACKAALFDPATSACSLFSDLQTLPTDANSNQLMLLMIVDPDSKKHLAAIIIGAVCAAILASLCSICAICYCCKRRRRTRKSESREASNEDVFLQALPRLPPRFTYSDLEVATKDFSKKLGSGGFGEVYEGVLPSGVKLAVKKLEGKSVQSSSQFRAEVASIGSVSHLNLVTLKGFCHDEDARLLVYEHMAKGSLDRWLFQEEKKRKQLSWERRCKIALDTAKGLAYLHHECAEKIVHCDVKPENILLDEEFNAKVGDFGLAKLVGAGCQSFAMTTLKGTRGYLAPEWLQHATITAKSDVYSYGVVLLELISARRCLDSDYGYLPALAFSVASSTLSSNSARHLAGRTKQSQHASGDDQSSMYALLDVQLADVSAASLEGMVYIGLWCLQSNPSARPPMSAVVQMLEGVVLVPPPPLQTPLAIPNDLLDVTLITSTSSSNAQFQALSSSQPYTTEEDCLLSIVEPR